MLGAGHCPVHVTLLLFCFECKSVRLCSELGGALYSALQGVAQVMIQSFQLSSCTLFNAVMQDVSPSIWNVDIPPFWFVVICLFGFSSLWHMCRIISFWVSPEVCSHGKGNCCDKLDKLDLLVLGTYVKNATCLLFCVMWYFAILWDASW